MRDSRYENMWGESPEEQEKRREWLRGVYDRATKPEQTPLQANNDTQTSLGQSGINNDNSRFGQTAYQSSQDMNTSETPLQQIWGATKDMARNYFDMKKDKTIGGDDYFHCKANFEASQRGDYGEKTAKALGDAKERFDYFKNRLFRAKSGPQAYQDYLHDTDVNMQGRHQAKTGLYSNSREGCNYFRVDGINEKY